MSVIARLPVAGGWLLVGLLYAGLIGFANPVWSADIAELRSGDMRRLVVHDAPRPVPDVAFRDADGATIRLRDMAGKVLLVNFWATWCAPCRVEKPTLNRLQAALGGRGFEVVAIATGRHRPDAIERFKAEHGIDRLAGYTDPDSALARAFGITGLPVTVLLDAEGREIARMMGGADWDSDSARAIMRAAMGR